MAVTVNVLINDNSASTSPLAKDETAVSSQSSNAPDVTTDPTPSAPRVKRPRTSRKPIPLPTPSLSETRPRRERKERVLYDPSDTVRGSRKQSSRKNSETPSEESSDLSTNNISDAQILVQSRKRKMIRQSSADPGERLDYSKVPKGWTFSLLNEYEPFMIEHGGLELDYYLCKRCKGPGVFSKNTTTYEMKRHSIRCISGNPEHRNKKTKEDGTSTASSNIESPVGEEVEADISE